MTKFEVNGKWWTIIDPDIPVFESPNFFDPEDVLVLMGELAKDIFPGEGNESIRRLVLIPSDHEHKHALADRRLSTLGANLRFSLKGWEYVYFGRTARERLLISMAPGNDMSPTDKRNALRALNLLLASGEWKTI